MKQTIFSLCIRPSSRGTITIHHFISYLRTLFYIPLLFCTAMVISNSAFASLHIKQLEINDRHYSENATIHFSESRPSSINGLTNFTILSTDFHIGNVKHPVSHGQAAIKIDDLDRLAGQETYLSIGYYLDQSQFSSEISKCSVRYPITWQKGPWWFPIYYPVWDESGWLSCADTAYSAYSLFGSSVSKHTINLNSSVLNYLRHHKINDVKNNIDDQLKDLSEKNYAFLKDKTSHLSNQDDFDQLESIQVDYVFGEAIKNNVRHFSEEYGYSDLLDANSILWVLKSINLSFDNGHINGIHAAFRSADCKRDLPFQINSLDRSIDIHYAKGYFVGLGRHRIVCDHNEHEFNQQRAEIIPTVPQEYNDTTNTHTDTQDNHYVFCDFYRCEFSVGNGTIYKVIMSLLSDAGMRDTEKAMGSWWFQDDSFAYYWCYFHRCGFDAQRITKGFNMLLEHSPKYIDLPIIIRK